MMSCFIFVYITSTAFPCYDGWRVSKQQAFFSWGRWFSEMRKRIIKGCQAPEVGLAVAKCLRYLRVVSINSTRVCFALRFSGQTDTEYHRFVF